MARVRPHRGRLAGLLQGHAEQVAYEHAFFMHGHRRTGQRLRQAFQSGGLAALPQLPE